MALDKLVDSSQLNSDLTSVANAIRAKSGGSGQLAFPAGFVSEIGSISTGSGLSGSITFAENTNFNGYSINVGGDFDFFAIYAASDPRNIVGGRTFCGLFKNFAANTSLNGMYIATNVGGSAYSGSMGISQATKSGQSVVFNTTDGGKFASGITYNWFAW